MQRRSEHLRHPFSHLKYCCTILLQTSSYKGNLKRIKKSEEHLEDVIDDLMKEAIDSTEIIHVK